MIKIFIVIFVFLTTLEGATITLYDLGFLVSKQTGKTVFFSSKVDQNFKIMYASTSINYLDLFKSALDAKGYSLVSKSSFYSVKVPEEEKKGGGLLDFPGLGGGNGALKPPPPLTGGGDLKVMSNGQPIYSSPFGRDANGSSGFGSSQLNSSFELVKFKVLNPTDLNATLTLSGFPFAFASSDSVIFSVPDTRLKAFKEFKKTLLDLDHVRDQVTLKITVYDSSNNALRDLGMSSLFNLDSNASFTSFGSVFSNAFIIGSFYSSLHSLESKGIATVTNSPTFLLSDRQALDFKSVLNLPFLDESFAFSATQGTNQSQKYKYKPIGFKVEITPTILGDLVYLDFFVSFESVVSTGSTGTLPTTSEKSIKNRFALKKGSMLVLAGIDGNSKKDVNDSSPILDKIPFLSSLFSRTQKSNSDTSFNIAIEVLNN